MLTGWRPTFLGSRVGYPMPFRRVKFGAAFSLTGTRTEERMQKLLITTVAGVLALGSAAVPAAAAPALAKPANPPAHGCHLENT